MAAREALEGAAALGPESPGWQRFVFPAMGTRVTVLVPSAWASMASVTADLFAEWEARLSRFRPTSELSRLNAAAGRPRRVGRLLYGAVETAILAALATDGLFDPTLLDRLEALGYDRTFETLVRDEPGRRSADPARPNDPRREGRDVTSMAARDEEPETRPGSDARRRPVAGRWRHIRLDRHSRTVELPPGVRLDLGGIAKGMAVDAAVALLAAVGVPAAAVEAGGDLAVLGSSPDGGRWRIEIEQPATAAPGNGASGGNPRPLVVELEAGAVATSSVGRRRWLAGGAWRHHLIDPRTGAPATGIWSATVAAPSCTEAEVAAKVALLLGADGAPAFLRRWGYSGVLIDEEGSVTAIETIDDRAAPTGAASGDDDAAARAGAGETVRLPTNAPMPSPQLEPAPDG
ncbi:MAG TPA: FAD:protein FMN transferase [Candidatus Binatia bacterium]|nr:FAD:protein FMN transferase [Candidatus Binatia bacterium]